VFFLLQCINKNDCADVVFFCICFITVYKKMIVQVACGSFFTAVVTSNGSVFVWGWVGDGIILNSRGWVRGREGREAGREGERGEGGGRREGVGGVPRQFRYLRPVLLDLAEIVHVTGATDAEGKETNGDVCPVATAVAAGGSSMSVVVSLEPRARAG
jgi:hypothetical protein